MTIHHNRSSLSSYQGFTLVEMIVTIAIATVLMAIATPSFIQARNNAELSDTVSDFMGAVNAARGNSLKQGVNTYIEPLDGVDWKSGWRVYADVNWDKGYTAGTDALVLERAALSASSGITLTTNVTANTLNDGYFLFNASGYPKKKNGALSTGQIVMANQYRSSTVMIAATGRVRSCKTDAC